MEKKLSQQYGFVNYIHQHNKDMSLAGYTDYCNLFLSINTILYKAPEYKAQYFFPNLLSDLINYYVNMNQYTRTEEFLDFFIKKSHMNQEGTKCESPEAEVVLAPSKPAFVNALNVLSSNLDYIRENDEYGIPNGVSITINAIDTERDKDIEEKIEIQKKINNITDSLRTLKLLG